MSDEGLREGWLANWLITERVTGLGGSCIQLTQSDMIALGLIVVKEMTHTHTQTLKPRYSASPVTVKPRKVVSRKLVSNK